MFPKERNRDVGAIIGYMVTLAGAALLLTGCQFAASPGRGGESKDSYNWRQNDTSLALLNHGRIVWQLNYNKQENKPYFHPVGLTDGTELTWLRPPDHPWHRGIWFSWKYINGLNYWEEGRRTGLSRGRTELMDVKVLPGRKYSASSEMTLHYHPPGKPPILTEKRLLSISSPDRQGRYYIDFKSIFTAATDNVLFERTPIKAEPGAKSWGGYAGLSVRIAKAISAWQALDSQGRSDIGAHGSNARWLDFSGSTAGGTTAGITIFDHPENMRHPTPWYVLMNPKVPFAYFSPAPLFNKPYTLAAGKSLILQYRILIHPGRLDKKVLENEWLVFTRSK